MQRNHPINRKYDRCVFLVFNCKDNAALNQTERLLLDATINKWKQNQDDPKGERIKIIFVNPNDFAPVNENDKPELDRRNRKYGPLTQLTSKSHLYLIGHHEINDNRLEISDDGSNNATPETYEYFDIDEVCALLIKYLRHASIRFHRELLLSAPTDSILDQRLKISVAMCNTAVGLLVNGSRSVENSFAYQMANRLYNQHPTLYIDCAVSGLKAWVYPIPGEPNLTKLAKLFIANTESILADEHYKTSSHKRFSPNLSFFGKVYQMPILMQGYNGYYRMYFAPSAKNTQEDIKKRQVTIECIEGTVWHKEWQLHLNQTVNETSPLRRRIQ